MSADANTPIVPATDVATTPVTTPAAPATPAAPVTPKSDDKALTYDQLLEKNAKTYGDLKETREEAKARRLENERLVTEKATLASENVKLKDQLNTINKGKVIDKFAAEAISKGFDETLARETAPADLTEENMVEKMTAFEEKWKHLAKPVVPGTPPKPVTTVPVVQPTSGQKPALAELTRDQLLAASIERTKSEQRN